MARTRFGKLLRAVIHDREMAERSASMSAGSITVTFVIGAVLGALGGAVTAPTISVVPGIGVEVIVLAFAVVVIGGLGSVAGTIVGALMVGIARAAAVHLLPEVELFVIYARHVAGAHPAAAGAVLPGAAAADLAHGRPEQADLSRAGILRIAPRLRRAGAR